MSDDEPARDAPGEPESPLGSLAGRVVLVTGAARGIGRAACVAAAESGADVVATDLRAADLDPTRRDIEERGRRAVAVDMDVTDTDAVGVGMDRAIGELGRLDGLVNSAGHIHMNPALETNVREWESQFRVNVSGLFACCREGAGRMEPGGAIVNVASNAGKVGYPNMAAYNASKAAVINLTRTLAAEWAERDINVNAVCPGGVDTPMLGGVADWIAARFGDDRDDVLAGMPPRQLGRLVQPIEVGRVIAFLLSPDARIIRGQSINVDGGDTPC